MSTHSAGALHVVSVGGYAVDCCTVMTSRPTVVVSFAQSLDGRIATTSGDSRWISGSETLTLAHELRRDNDAILVGIGTVLRDDPELSCRLAHEHYSPLRIVLDSRLRLPEASRIVQTAPRFRTIVATLGDSAPEQRTRLGNHNITVADFAADQSGSGVDLQQLLRWLASQGIRSLFVEGGSSVITSFVRQRLVDRLLLVIAPMLIGDGTPAIGDLGTRALADAIRLAPGPPRQLGRDLVWELEFPPQA